MTVITKTKRHGQFWSRLQGFTRVVSCLDSLVLPKYSRAVYTHPTDSTLVALEIIWMFLKGLRKESCRAVWSTRESTSSASAASTSARSSPRLPASHRDVSSIFYPPPLSALFFQCKSCSVFYNPPKYSTPHSSSRPSQRDPSKGMWVGRKKGVNSSMLIAFCPCHNDM